MSFTVTTILLLYNQLRTKVIMTDDSESQRQALGQKLHNFFALFMSFRDFGLGYMKGKTK